MICSVLLAFASSILTFCPLVVVISSIMVSPSYGISPAYDGLTSCIVLMDFHSCDH